MHMLTVLKTLSWLWEFFLKNKQKLRESQNQKKINKPESKEEKPEGSWQTGVRRRKTRTRKGKTRVRKQKTRKENLNVNKHKPETVITIFQHTRKYFVYQFYILKKFYVLTYFLHFECLWHFDAIILCFDLFKLWVGLFVEQEYAFYFIVLSTFILICGPY